MSDIEPRQIVDRVATEGQWLIEVDYYSRKRRRTHYYNGDSNSPVCGEHAIDLTNAVPATLEEGSTVVKPVEARENRHGHVIEFGVTCRNCISIVVNGVDLKAKHARWVLGIAPATTEGHA